MRAQLIEKQKENSLEKHLWFKLGKYNVQIIQVYCLNCDYNYDGYILT